MFSEDVVLPEKPKLKFMNKVPNLKRVRKEMKRLRDIRGQAKTANDFTTGLYAIVAMGGGYLHWGHIEMMRLTINRKMDSRTTFARWRINAPYKPITRKAWVMSRESLAAMHKKQAEREQNNQNPWTFKMIARGNMMGIRKAISPFDLHNHGRFTGKFHLPGRV
ncbi:hypothetical protein INR49_026856 [Caranx melampygus]|nr:hypothetical protein INR49_026856 [Caranx melampygus]